LSGKNNEKGLVNCELLIINCEFLTYYLAKLYFDWLIKRGVATNATILIMHFLFTMSGQTMLQFHLILNPGVSGGS